MTPEQLREAASVMLAAADGKKIEVRAIAMYGNWVDTNCGRWDWSKYVYRIKPEPRKVRVRLYKDRCSPHNVRGFDATKEGPPTWWIPISDIVEIEVRDA